MKIITKTYFKIMTAAITMLVSCSEESRIPEPIRAANVRIQFETPEDQLVNFADIANARIKYNIFSANKNLESVELTFLYNNAATGLAEGPFVLRTYTQEDFNDANGAIRDEIFTADQLAVIVGKADGSELNGGDNFVFSNRTTLTDGRIYPGPTVGGNLNVTPGILNNAATESFSAGWVSYVACPVPAGYATGKYLVEQISGPNDPFFGNPTRFASEEVTLVAASPIQRDFEGTYFTFASTFTFLLVCDNFLVNDGSGVGCGVGLRWATPAVPSTYDDTDDSVLLINVLDNADGDCGLPAAEPLTLRLTKVD